MIGVMEWEKIEDGETRRWGMSTNPAHHSRHVSSQNLAGNVFRWRVAALNLVK